MFYSNNCRQDLKEIICISLKKAKKSIYLSTYGLSDPQVLSILKKKLREGISLTITCHAKEILAMERHLGKSIQIIPFESKGLAHEKIIIIDDQLIWLGSTNLTQTSLSLHDNLLIGIFSGDLANNLRLRTPGEMHTLSIKGQRIEMYFLPEKNSVALNRILSIIDSAKKEIQIALFTFTHPKIELALSKAKDRGVIVTVVIDQFLARGCCKKTVNRLKKSSCLVRSSNSYKLMHHKWARIDKNIFITGSANWTNSAFEKNRDYILIVAPIDKIQNNFIDKLWINLYRHSTL